VLELQHVSSTLKKLRFLFVTENRHRFFDVQRFSNGRVAVGLMLTLSQVTPRWLGHALIDWVTRSILCRRRSIAQQAIRANQWVLSGGTLSPAELDRRVCQVLRFSGRALFDHYHNLRAPQRVQRLVSFSARLQTLLAERQQQRNGAVFVGPHTAAFDLAGLALAQAGLRLLVLSFPQPPSGYQLQNELRRLSGIDVMPFTVDALRAARQCLQNGGTVLTGVDRPWPDATYRPHFFGRPAALPVSYVPLALRNQVPLYVVWCWAQSDGSYQVDCSEPIWLQSHPNRETEILVNAETVLRVVEKVLQAHPEQWSMTYPVWPEVLDEQIF
jgi:KDO2-lipid IV(A) lauroyltransferase